MSSYARAPSVLALGIAAAAAGGALLWSYWSRRLRKGDLVCAGWNGFGQLGIGTSDYSPGVQSVAAAQLQLDDREHVESVSVGGLHFAGFSVALSSHGRVWVWGDNSRGQLGLGSVKPRLQPTPLLLRRTWCQQCGSASSYGIVARLLCRPGERGSPHYWSRRCEHCRCQLCHAFLLPLRMATMLW